MFNASDFGYSIAGQLPTAETKTLNRVGVASGNAAIDRQRKGFFETYDRGELLWLIAENVRRKGADLEALAVTADLSEAEIADVLTMID